MNVSVYQLDFLGLLKDGEHQDVQNVNGLLAMNPSSSPMAHLTRDAPGFLLHRLREQNRGNNAHPTDTHLLYGHSRCR